MQWKIRIERIGLLSQNKPGAAYYAAAVHGPSFIFLQIRPKGGFPK